MKLKLLTLIATTILATQAAAQSVFEGFYTQVGVGYESSDLTASNSAALNANGSLAHSISYDKNPSPDGVLLVLAGGYNYELFSRFLLGIGGDWSAFNNTRSEAISISGLGHSQSKIQFSDRFSIFITPAYELDNDKLVYFKAGYTGQAVKGINDNATSASYGSLTGQADLQGYVLGVGYKQVITGGLFGFVEGNWYDYSSSRSLVHQADGSLGTANISAFTYTLTAGVGYKF